MTLGSYLFALFFAICVGGGFILWIVVSMP